MLVGFCFDYVDLVCFIFGGGFIVGVGWVSGVCVMIIVDDVGIDVGVV